MPNLQTEILVIGGGATGTGILRDLAMRGFKAILVEKRDLSHGTTGRYHGLLHSGGRYAVKDPQAARECIVENRILRRILPQCIEDTGGFFVTSPEDDPDYASHFIPACQQAGIPVEEISVAKMLAEEPLLNPKIKRCFRVPDASADSFMASELNAASAQSYSAQVLVYHEVKTLLVSGERIIGATCHNLVTGESIDIHADMVVNASGAWVGKIAATAGISINILPGKGTMLAINHRAVHTVVNRCKMPSDGDIIVPAHTVAVVGTTDVTVKDPDHFAIEPWEVQLLLAEGEKLIPKLRTMRILRAWAGVRPLYQDSGPATDSRDLSRAFVLLDHSKRDGIEGLVTITSGKWTTYRLMAQKTVDLVCEKLYTHRPCRTDQEQIPGTHPYYHVLGNRLSHIENNKYFGKLICECELTTDEDVKKAIILGKAVTLDDIRRETRLGMGPCQGGFCTLRVAGILQELTQAVVEETNAAIRDFLQERWKGLLPILWGSQLRQERLDQLIYLDVLNIPALPGPHTTRLKSENYDHPTQVELNEDKVALEPLLTEIKNAKTAADRSDILVIGAGLAGLVTAWQASQNKKSVSLVSKGWGATYWASGAIDILGYLPEKVEKPILDLPFALNELLTQNPEHPYNKINMDILFLALEAFKELCNQSDYPMVGSIEQNILLPSSVGSARPTCIAPQTMIQGDLSLIEPMIIIGFQGFLDFYPSLIASNISTMGIPTQYLSVELPGIDSLRQITGMVLARSFDDPKFLLAFIRKLKDNLKSSLIGTSHFRLGLPAVLGLNHTYEIWQQLTDELGCPVFEIPGLPPSIPGIRLHNILSQAITHNGGKILNGQQAVMADCKENRVETVYTEAAARFQLHYAKQYVLATGGVLGGGYLASSNNLNEMVFNLPLTTPTPETWFNAEFLAPKSHPIFHAGVKVDEYFHPLQASGEIIYKNLYTVGSALGGFDPIHERSLEGVALASGFTVGRKITQEGL
jgi:glycerol-3-phosphate dehydrogenase